MSAVTGVFPLLPRMRLYRSGHGKAVLFCTAAQGRGHNRNNPGFVLSRECLRSETAGSLGFTSDERPTWKPLPPVLFNT